MCQIIVNLLVVQGHRGTGLPHSLSFSCFPRVAYWIEMLPGRGCRRTKCRHVVLPGVHTFLSTTRSALCSIYNFIDISLTYTFTWIAIFTESERTIEEWTTKLFRAKREGEALSFALCGLCLSSSSSKDSMGSATKMQLTDGIGITLGITKRRGFRRAIALRCPMPFAFDVESWAIKFEFVVFHQSTKQIACYHIQ